MVKINLKTIMKILLQSAAGTGATVGAYEGLGCSEEESVACGVGAFVVSGIALNVLIPSGKDDLYRKIKKVRSEEDLENLVDDLNEDVDEDEGDDDGEEPDIFDGIEEDVRNSDDGDLDPTEETVVSSTHIPPEDPDWELFEKLFAEEFGNKFQGILEDNEIQKSIREIGEKYGTDDDGYAYSPNGVRWKIPNHEVKKSSRKERKAKNLLRNNQLQKKYLEHKYSRFQAHEKGAAV